MSEHDDELALSPEDEAAMAEIDEMFKRPSAPPPPSAGRRVSVLGNLGLLMAIAMVSMPSAVDPDE